MPWIVLDLTLVLLALVVLALLGLRLYRQVRQLSRDVASASRTLAPHTQALSQAQAARPTGDSDVG